MNREAALRARMIEGAKEWRRRVIGEAPHAKVDLLPPPVPSPERAAAQGALVSAGKKRRGDRRKEYDRENKRCREARAAARAARGTWSASVAKPS